MAEPGCQTWRVSDETNWFSTRCVFHHRDPEVYEERITVWRAADADAAIELAEAEAQEYATVNEIQFNGFVQAYAMFDELESGAEVFSLGRTSELAEDEYLTRFFHTGAERQREIED
jgi:hypothetical protein